MALRRARWDCFHVSRICAKSSFAANVGGGNRGTQQGRAHRCNLSFAGRFPQRTADDTIADQLGQGFAIEHLPRPDPADDERVGGWMLMYELLRTDKWMITRNCNKLIESLPILTRNEANIEDILKSDGDDVADSARYGIKSRLDPRRTSLSGIEANIAARAERIATDDPTSRAIWMRKLEAEARKKTGSTKAPRRWRV